MWEPFFAEPELDTAALDDCLVPSGNFERPTSNGVAEENLDRNGIVDFTAFLLLSASFLQ